MTLQTIWTPGRTGWQGRQGSKTSLIVLAGFIGLALIGYAAILLTETSVPLRMQVVAVVLIGVLGAWMLAAHMRVSRVRVVQVLAEPARVTFGRPRGILLPLRLLSVAGVLLLVAWILSLTDSVSDRIPMLSLLLTPVCALCLIYGGVRAFFDSGKHSVWQSPTSAATIRTWDEDGQFSPQAASDNAVSMYAVCRAENR